MTSLEKKNKRKGIIGTILFHALLLVAFLFMGLTYQVPPPPEKGIAIDFGNQESAGGSSENTEQETETKEEKNVSTKEIATQSVEKTQKVDQKAIYTPKGSGGKSDGNGSGKSDEEEEEEEEGGGGGSGDYQLGDREAIEKPKPQGNQEVGKVVVIITVDRLGNVTYANPTAAGSTTYDKDLFARAKEAAEKTKFKPDPEAPENQQGKIIYDFRVN